MFLKSKKFKSKRYPVSLSANRLGAVWGKPSHTLRYLRYLSYPSSGLDLPLTINEREETPRTISRLLQGPLPLGKAKHFSH